jgi:hypothetical protein
MKSRRNEFPTAIAIAVCTFCLFFAIDSSAIIDGGSGLSVDQLIDASRGTYVFNTGIPENPQEARKLWSEEKGINFTMPGKLTGSGTTPQETRSSANTGEVTSSQNASAASSIQAKAASSPEPTISPASRVAGNWSLRLSDSKNRFIAIRLFQSENTVLGTGNMNDGGDTLKVLASGSISTDKLNLDVISSGVVNLYRFSLNLSSLSASGEYRAFSTSGERWRGTVEGTLDAN